MFVLKLSGIQILLKNKICIIEVYFLKYYFESHLIYVFLLFNDAILDKQSSINEILWYLT